LDGTESGIQNPKLKTGFLISFACESRNRTETKTFIYFFKNQKIRFLIPFMCETRTGIETEAFLVYFILFYFGSKREFKNLRKK
jgi:hypothetical protein